MEMIKVIGYCPFCGQMTEVEAPLDGVAEWQAGELVQKALPGLNATQRETLISGLCEDCQEGLFGADDDEEYWEDEIYND